MTKLKLRLNNIEYKIDINDQLTFQLYTNNGFQLIDMVRADPIPVRNNPIPMNDAVQNNVLATHGTGSLYLSQARQLGGVSNNWRSKSCR